MEKSGPVNQLTAVSDDGTHPSSEGLVAGILACNFNAAKEAITSIFTRSSDRWVCKITANYENQDNQKVEDLMELQFGSKRAANDFAANWLQENGKHQPGCTYDALIFKLQEKALDFKEQQEQKLLPCSGDLENGVDACVHDSIEDCTGPSGEALFSETEIQADCTTNNCKNHLEGETNNKLSDNDDWVVYNF